MKREEKMEELLSSKSFDELTLPEKELVLHELGSEEQYEAMRKIGVTLVKKTAGLSPDPKILKSLQQQMVERRKSTSQLAGLLAFRIPVYASVLLIILFSGVTWFVAGRMRSAAPALPVTILKTDTLYLTSKPDTVFKDRVIYRYAKWRESFPPSLNRTVQAEPVQKPTAITGVSMKESEALEKLLVSGSK